MMAVCGERMMGRDECCGRRRTKNPRSDRAADERRTRRDQSAPPVATQSWIERSQCLAAGIAK